MKCTPTVSAGKLDGFLTIWWDKNRPRLYYYLSLSQQPQRRLQEWRYRALGGELFVNDLPGDRQGKKGHHGETHLPLRHRSHFGGSNGSRCGAMRDTNHDQATRHWTASVLVLCTDLPALALGQQGQPEVERASIMPVWSRPIRS